MRPLHIWGLDYTVSVARFWDWLVAVVDLDYSGILPFRLLLVLVLCRGRPARLSLTGCASSSPYRGRLLTVY